MFKKIYIKSKNLPGKASKKVGYFYIMKRHRFKSSVVSRTATSKPILNPQMREPNAILYI